MSTAGAGGMPLAHNSWRGWWENVARSVTFPGLLVWAIAPLAIMLVSWQPQGLAPIGGLDPSWMSGLAVAVHNGIPFGKDVVFTYGPLGFLSSTIMWYGAQGVLAFVYLLVIRFGLAVAVFAGARRNFGAPAGFVVAVVVVSVAGQLNQESAIALIVMIAALSRELGRWEAISLAAVTGALSGIELLNKASVGMALLAMTLVLALTLRRRPVEVLVAALGAAAVAFACCWLTLGEPVSAVPAYIANSEQIVTGYAGAMAQSGPAWQVVAALAALVLGAWACRHATGGLERRRRGGAVALWCVFWFFAFKEGFVRGDGGHVLSFFDALLAASFAFTWRRGRRLVGLAFAGALVAGALVVSNQSITGRLTPVSNAHAALSEFRQVASPGRRAATIAAGRARVEASEPIDPTSLRMLEGHTVAVYPTEIAQAWAYQLDLDPIPVLQSYSAYTSALDRLDATFLDSARAPQRILVAAPPATLDSRVAAFDQPLTARTMLCRFSVLRATPSLAVLGSGADRCGSPALLGRAHAGWGQAVAVPAPPTRGSLVFVRISGVQVGGLESVRQLLFKPAVRFISLDGGPLHRLVAGTADDGLPLRAAAGVDFPGPYGLAPGARSLAVFKSGQHGTGGTPITFSFYSEPIRPEAQRVG